MTETTSPRVVVVDDSALMRRIVAAALEDHGIEVVGFAADGAEALRLADELHPDAMTLDLAMPGTDGIEVLRRLRRHDDPVPVVVVSAFSPAAGARAVDALAEGAFELVAKPGIEEGPGPFVAALTEKVRLAAAARRRRGERATARRRVLPPPRRRATDRAPAVVIACSTGGPRALAELMPELPARLGAGTLIVQHMPPNFTSSLAARLDAASQLTVREARGGERLEPAVALLAPGGWHMRVDRARIALSDAPPIGALRPRADVTIADVVAEHGADTVLVVLTGMGQDGLEGARAVRAAGGRVLVEDESTCTVHGMPRAVESAGLADRVLPLGELARAIAQEAA